MNKNGNTPEQILQSLLGQATKIVHETADLNNQHEYVCAELFNLGFHLYNDNRHSSYMETEAFIPWMTEYGEGMGVKVNIRTLKPALQARNVTPLEFESAILAGGDEKNELFAILSRALHALDSQRFVLQIVSIPNGKFVQILLHESTRFVTLMEFVDAEIKNKLPE